jgi:heme-degrading monooxygenase HmoA
LNSERWMLRRSLKNLKSENLFVFCHNLLFSVSNQQKKKMRKVLIIVALIATTFWASAQTKEVTEIAIYRISETQNNNFHSLLTYFRKQVSQLKGYKSYTTLQDVHNPNIYIDILPWSNINTALVASDSVKNGKNYKPFTSAIDSLVAYGEFYPFKRFIQNKNKINMQSKITEVVIYQIKADKVNTYERIAENTNLFLKAQKGFISRKIMQDHKDKTIFMDIVEWDTQADAEAAMQKSQQETSLLPFFEATEKVIILSHYSFFK